MNTLFVKKLTTLDFSYLCPERGLVGETWVVDLSISGSLNEEGMLFDFGHVKKILKKTADDFADHKLLVPALSSFIDYREEHGISRVKMNAMGLSKIYCEAPTQAINALQLETIEMFGVLPLLTNHMERAMPKNIAKINLHLYPEAINGAYYHYSHGLKKHKGDCQRIAHGHRSRIEIYVNEERSPSLEEEWSDKWKDIYLASAEDVKEKFTEKSVSYLTFAYSSSQGDFLLTLPECRTYIIDTDTTVELLSEHVTVSIKRCYPEKKIRSVLYEGIDKGASSCK